MTMDKKLKLLMANMEFAEAAEIDDIERARRTLDFVFPEDYCDFLLFSNGARGEIGDEYIEIWSVAELLEANADIEINLYAPGLVAFGGDGGNELFAFDGRVKNRKPIVQIPMIGMSIDDALFCGETFSDFLLSRGGS